MIPNNSKNNEFIQEYLYIEEVDYQLPPSKFEEKEKQEKVERGVIIIDIM